MAELIDEIAKDIFTDGQGREADRLILEFNGKTDNTGRNQVSIARIIKKHLESNSGGNAGYKEPADIYELKLHQTIDIQKNNAEYLPFRYVTRVPGGWIYSNYNTDSDTYADKLFIPFDNDMQKAGSL